MVTIVELTKTLTQFNDSFFYESPFVYQARLSVPNDFTSYFLTTFGSADDLNKTRVFIKKVAYLNESYAIRDSLANCQALEKSFYFDLENQTLYIHVNHNIVPDFSLFQISTIEGFTNTGVKEYNGIPYTPDLISVPAINDSVDPVQREQIKFTTGSIVFNNAPVTGGSEAGKFDTQKLKGQDVFVFVGEDDDTYSELTQVFSFYILNQVVNFEQCTISVRDKREKFNTKIPTERFNLTEYANIGEDKIDQVKPLFLGYGRHVPGICIDENSGVGAKNFRFSDTITGTPTIEAKKNDKWVTVTPTSINNSDGTVTLALADSHVDGDITRGILDIRGTGTFEDLNTPGDQIAYLNARYVNIPFTTSDYDITEWNGENALLAETGIYIDKFQDLFQYVRQLQNGSDVGFNYEINGEGKATLRLDNPNRTATMSIQAVEIINNGDIEKDFNFELFFSSTSINYDKSWNSGSYRVQENNDFRFQVLQENGGRENIFENNSLIPSLSNAENKSLIVLDDTKEDRPIWKIVVFGRKFFSLRNFDILNAVLSYPGQIEDVNYNDIIQVDFNSTDIIQTTENTTDQIRTTHLEREESIINNRLFDGEQRVQIIGRRHNYNTETVELTLRQKPYSEVFFNIKGV